MDLKTLLRKYRALLAENQALKEENLSLKARLGLADPLENRSSQEGVQQDASPPVPSFHLQDTANPAEKIQLFMSLFKGRDDLYAKRWESRAGRCGYAPVCLNEWQPGFCGKPEVKCTSCKHRSYAPLDEKVIEAHLRGNLVAGIYPLLRDEKCHFLAMDFDKDGWQQDVAILREVCTAFAAPVAIERSRSGHGAQAMRMSTFGKPRIISCSEETPEYLCLPRGCEADLATLLMEAGVEVEWSDKTHRGRHIQVAFTGLLREDQELAAETMLKHDCGVLSAATAFGKTVIAARLIAARQTNTLILTHRQQLLSQWLAKLAQFLEIDAELLAAAARRGRKLRRSFIGQIGAGKVNPGGIIDVAIMQSLASGGEMKECIKDYGMVIVDECHHVPAFSFEQVLKKVHARFIYGLTATPTRRDGHHPIIFMHCGPVRYHADARKEAKKRPFEHYVVPRFTGFRTPFDREEKDISIQEFYSLIATDEWRNQQITDDVIRAYESGRNTLILTERTAQVELLAGKLREKIPEVLTLTGGKSRKETGNVLARIAATPAGGQLTLVATGRYIGEGFDEPRLDTLFLAMPISWRGTLQQYAGRLHRLFENKKEVRIYDYVDIHVGALERMYQKRLAGYAAIGYRAKAESVAAETADIIFDNTNFLAVYHNDLRNAAREAVIVSPFVTRKRAMQMLPHLEAALARGVAVAVVTRPADAYHDKHRPALEETLASLKDTGVRLLFKANIHQKFAVFDRKIVWYGSINLLSYGSSQESIMRLASPNISQELLKSLGKDRG